MTGFSADWLALREPFDAAVRSISLARRFAAALPTRPRILDIGAGTGSMRRWLAPIIGREPSVGREASSILADADAELLERARAPGVAPLLLDFGNAPDALPLGSVDGIVCSALLDLVSQRWLHRLVAALRTPFLACLSVDGRDEFSPAHPLDAEAIAAFRRDQMRDKGFGPALGTAAPATLQAALVACGFQVACENSDWCIPPAAKPMLRELVLSHARILAEDQWRSARLSEIDRENLAIRIGHRDILGLPA